MGDHLNNRDESRLGKIPLECVARYITIINSTNRSIYMQNKHFEYGWSRKLYSGECQSIYKKQLDQVNYFQIVTSIIGDVRTSTTVMICTATSDSAEDCPSSEGVYEVSAGRSGFVITKVEKTAEELNKMGCF